MQVLKTKLKGVLQIDPPTVFQDFRGTYIETYNKELYKFAPEFVQDDFSISRENVLRGIHGDDKTWKLISCLWGKFYLVVVNYDDTSKQFKQWDSFVLSDINKQQVLIPPKFGNGHLVLSDAAIFHYKQSTYYDRASQFTLKWNDPTLKIKWPIENPILSERDK
jgi:dTDP-4-dehydrorhamnose 3,5-epimerase